MHSGSLQTSRMIHFRKIISKVNVKLPTIFAKRFILGAWLGSECVSADRYNVVPEIGNLWTFDTLIDFCWNFWGKMELMKVRNIYPEETVFCEQFYLETQIIFWWNFLLNHVFQTKAVFPEKKMKLLAFLGGSNKAISTTWGTLIHQRFVVQIVIQWWFWRTVSLNWQ